METISKAIFKICRILLEEIWIGNSFPKCQSYSFPVSLHHFHMLCVYCKWKITSIIYLNFLNNTSCFKHITNEEKKFFITILNAKNVQFWNCKHVCFISFEMKACTVFLQQRTIRSLSILFPHEILAFYLK